MGSDGKVKFIVASAGEVLALQLAQQAISAVIDLLRSGGYPKPTAEQFRRLARGVSREALAAGLTIVGVLTPTDEQLDEAALGTAREAVREVMGPPPREALS